MGAKGLPVVAVPEQAVIALVWNDMVNVGCECGATGMGTMRMRSEVDGTCLAPFVVITTLGSRWAATIMAGLTGAVGGDLAGATLTQWYDGAATAKAGWCNRHQRNIFALKAP